MGVGKYKISSVAKETTACYLKLMLTIRYMHLRVKLSVGAIQFVRTTDNRFNKCSPIYFGI